MLRSTPENKQLSKSFGQIWFFLDKSEKNEKIFNILTQIISPCDLSTYTLITKVEKRKNLDHRKIIIDLRILYVLNMYTLHLA